MEISATALCRGWAPDRKEAAERDVSGWEDVLNCTFNRFSRFSTDVEDLGLVRRLENKVVKFGGCFIRKVRDRWRFLAAQMKKMF